MRLDRKCACGCEARIAAAYRQDRKTGRPGHVALLAAFREFEQSHPDAGTFSVLGAVKDILSSEIETGIVDCGEA